VNFHSVLNEIEVKINPVLSIINKSVVIDRPDSGSQEEPDHPDVRLE